jgi:hypothetical protein
MDDMERAAFTDQQLEGIIKVAGPYPDGRLILRLAMALLQERKHTREVVYHDRNLLALALAEMALACGLPAAAGMGDEPGWPVLYVMLPGNTQVSYHLPDSGLVGEALRGLYDQPAIVWDGHSDEEKRQRLVAFILNMQLQRLSGGAAGQAERLQAAADHLEALQVARAQMAHHVRLAGFTVVDQYDGLSAAEIQAALAFAEAAQHGLRSLTATPIGAATTSITTRPDGIVIDDPVSETTADGYSRATKYAAEGRSGLSRADRRAQVFAEAVALRHVLGEPERMRAMPPAEVVDASTSWRDANLADLHHHSRFVNVCDSHTLLQQHVLEGWMAGTLARHGGEIHGDRWQALQELEHLLLVDEGSRLEPGSDARYMVRKVLDIALQSIAAWDRLVVAAGLVEPEACRHCGGPSGQDHLLPWVCLECQQAGRT